MSTRTIIRNGRVVLPSTILDNAEVVIENGVIVEVSDSAGPVSDDCEIVDAGGNYVAPGCIDLHTHGAGGADFMDGTVEAYLTAARTHATHGTTLLYPTTLTCSDEVLFKSFDLYDDACRRNIEGAQFGGIHLEGPFFNPEKAGAQDPKFLCNPTPEHYNEILSRTDKIVRWSAAPELPGSEEFGRVLRDRGILAAFGHTDATFEECDKAFKEGFTHMNHFYSAMSSVVRRNAYRYAGAVEYGYYNDAVTVEIICDGIHVPSSLLHLVQKIKGIDSIALITDSMRAAGMPEGPSVLGGLSDGQPVIVEDGVAKLMDRSAFAGSVATADRLIRTITRVGDATLVDAMKMASLTPARIMGIASRKGSIEKGKDADIIIFDGDIDIKRTIIGGRTVYEKA